MSRVAVVIPNRNRAGLLRRTLESVAGQTVAATRVVVVDNGSTDDSVEVSRSAGAEVLEWPDNRGFAAAVNAGARVCDEEWLLILNNDAELDRGCLAALIACAERQRAACVAPRLLSWANPALLDGGWDLLSRGGAALRCGHGLLDGPGFREERLIGFAPLTATLMRRELCELDEGFGSYLEDVELSLRLQLAGQRIAYAPEAVVRHHGSATDGAWSARMVYLISRNQVLLVARHYPSGWWMQEGWAVVVAQGLWGLAALRQGCFGAWLAGKWRGMREYRVFRGPKCSDSKQFRAVLRASDGELREYVRRHPTLFWRVYFALTRPG